MKKLAKLTALLAAAALLLGAVGCSDDDGNSFLSKQKTVDVKTKDGSVTSVSSDVVFDPAGIAKATVYGTKIIVTPLRAGTTVMTIKVSGKVSGEEYKDKEVKILITVAEDGTIEYEDDDGTGGNTGSGGSGNNSGGGNNGASGSGSENQDGGDGNNSSGGGTGSDSSNPGTGGTTGGTTGGSGNGSENQGGGEEDDGGNPGPVNPGTPGTGDKDENQGGSSPGTGNEGENKGGEGDGDYGIPSKPGTGGNDIDSGKTPGNGDKDENKGDGGDNNNPDNDWGADIVKATAKTYDFTKWSPADLEKFGGEFYTNFQGIEKNQLKSPMGATELSTGATIYNSEENMIMIRTQSTTDKTPTALNYNGARNNDLSSGVDVSKLDRYVIIPVDGEGKIIAFVKFVKSSSGTGNLQAAFVDADGKLLGKVVEMDVSTGGEAMIEGFTVFPTTVILAFSCKDAGGGGLDVYSISVAP